MTGATMTEKENRLESPSVFESEIQLRPSDIDYNGHVHHSRYFDFLLAARQDQMARCYKMSMEEFVRRGLSWMVRSYQIEYKRGLTMHDFARVQTWVIAMGNPDEGKRARSLATIGFKIFISDTPKLAAHGVATYVLVSMENGRPVKIPKDVIEKYSV
jgi:acyl-CoA thioester hydrolase/thioesterase-3